jgi:hypothetical protein
VSSACIRGAACICTMQWHQCNGMLCCHAAAPCKRVLGQPVSSLLKGLISWHLVASRQHDVLCSECNEQPRLGVYLT